MAMLVTLDQAKAHLKMDHDEDDDDITLKVEAASAAVLAYLRAAAMGDYLDSSGQVIFDSSGVSAVPAQVQAAVLTLTGILFRDPTGTAMKDWEMGYLPFPVTALLYPLRDPALA